MRDIGKFSGGLTAKVHDGHMSVDALADADVIANHYVSANRTSSEQGS